MHDFTLKVSVPAIERWANCLMAAGLDVKLYNSVDSHIVRSLMADKGYAILAWAGSERAGYWYLLGRGEVK